jgi:hypothetical protein
MVTCLWCHCGHQPGDLEYCHYMTGFNLMGFKPELRQTFKFTSSWVKFKLHDLHTTESWKQPEKVMAPWHQDQTVKPAAAAWVGQPLCQADSELRPPPGPAGPWAGPRAGTQLRPASGRLTLTLTARSAGRRMADSDSVTLRLELRPGAGAARPTVTQWPPCDWVGMIRQETWNSRQRGHENACLGQHEDR